FVVARGEERRMPRSYPILYAHKALARGGKRSLADFEDALGLPGRFAVTTSRISRPIVENPRISAAAAGLGAAVVAGGIFAGYKLRQKRLAAHRPYSYFRQERLRRTGTDDTNAIGI